MKEKSPAYPTVRSEIRTFSMQGNLTRFDIPNLFQNRNTGPIDCRVVGQLRIQWRCDPKIPSVSRNLV